MSTGPRDDGGVPRIRRALVAVREEDWHGANEAKTDKLRHRSLQRRARARGIELRHSAYGYALIDAANKRIDERSDLTLDEIESWLARA
ncbi:MAG: hypothetical protein ACXVRK_04815 [Gaiellaceae bacterium]